MSTASNNDLGKIVELSKFNILKIIGNGGFGKIYLIIDKITGEKYAAKENLSNDQKFGLMEKDAYLKLQHPTIVKFFGYSLLNFRGKPRVTIIMEYIGNTLQNILKKPNNELTNTNKYIILLGTAISLKYIHSQGIIHKNIKPGKILLDEKLYPHICGFEISYITDQEIDKIEMDDQVGTPIYMAPEVFEEGIYSYKVDSYSFGILMYETISNTRAYKTINTYMVMNDVINGMRPDINLIRNEKFSKLIEKCWSGDYSQRPNFIEIVEEMKTEEFQRSFDVDLKEVETYLHFINEI